jgi:hypothetical protein
VNEERAKEAVEHLQQAALEMIEAMRAVLDLAEEAVKDPEPLVGMASSTAQALLTALVRLGAEVNVPGAHGPGNGAGNGDGAGPGHRHSPGVQRIKVS